MSEMMPVHDSGRTVMQSSTVQVFQIPMQLLVVALCIRVLFKNTLPPGFKFADYKLMITPIALH
jgi:hypothetical protein